VIKQGFDRSRAVFGRQETFKIGDKECTLVLIKNPVGATQAIEMIKLAPYPFSLSVLLNANYADGIDTSWIWDADFEQITQMDIPEINAGGVRHSEIARRLRVTGYPAEKITEMAELKEELFYEILDGIPVKDIEETIKDLMKLSPEKISLVKQYIEILLKT